MDHIVKTISLTYIWRRVAILIKRYNIYIISRIGTLHMAYSPDKSGNASPNAIPIDIYVKPIEN